MSWLERAACGGELTELWFPPNYNNPEHTAYAFAVCETCPVQIDCYQAAMDEEGDIGAGYRYGIRGGTTPGERWRMFLSMAPSQCEVCGDKIVQPKHGRRTLTCSPVCARERHNRRRRMTDKEATA